MKKHYNLRIELIKKEAIEERMKIYGITDISTIVRFILSAYYDYLKGKPAKKIYTSMFEYIDLLRDRKITKHYNVPMASIVLVSNSEFDVVIDYFKELKINKSSIIRAAFESLFICSVLELHQIEKEVSFNSFYKRLDVNKYKMLMSCCVVTPEDYEKLFLMASNQKRSVSAFVDRTLKSMAQCYYNDTEHHSTKFNKNAIKQSMIIPFKRLPLSESISFMVGINGADNVTKILLMAADFRIKSVNEFIRRGVRFIIDSYDNKTDVIDVRDVIDNDDYNEVRLVRNEFKNSILYGNK